MSGGAAKARPRVILVGVGILPTGFDIAFNTCVSVADATWPGGGGGAMRDEFLSACCGDVYSSCYSYCRDAGGIEDWQCRDTCDHGAFNCVRGDLIFFSTDDDPLFEAPVVEEISPSPRVDYCLDGDTGCGAPAAHAYCQRYVGSDYRARQFAGDGEPASIEDATWQLGAWYPRQPYGTGQGFIFIECAPSEATLPTTDVAGDGDDDGHPDGVDNCPAWPNPLQANGDGDAFGDLCDPEPNTVHACSNGLDDDGDGFTDEADPGCVVYDDAAETDGGLVCDNGLDDDEDGLVDTSDSDCAGPTDSTESPGACVDGVDGDGDGLVDLDDPGCGDSGDASELGDRWSPYFDGWDPSTKTRHFGDANGDGRDDIVALGSNGVYVALSGGSAFGEPALWSTDPRFRADPHDDVSERPRFVRDLDGDGRVDVLLVSGPQAVAILSDGSTFGPVQSWSQSLLDEYEYASNLLWLEDVTGDDLPDLIEAEGHGIWVSRNTGSDFAPPARWSEEFGSASEAGGWSRQTPRELADVDGDGLLDLVGFGHVGTRVARNTGTGFAPSRMWSHDFGIDYDWAWNYTPRTLADVNGDGLEDVVGFKSDGVLVALSTGAAFTSRRTWLPEVRSTHDEWHAQMHPKFVVDLDLDGRADFLGIGPQGVRLALSDGEGFGVLQSRGVGFSELDDWSWYYDVRDIADPDGDGQPELAGYGPGGVWVGELAIAVSEDPVPEPGLVSGLLAGGGVLAALGVRRRISRRPQTGRHGNAESYGIASPQSGSRCRPREKRRGPTGAPGRPEPVRPISARTVADGSSDS